MQTGPCPKKVAVSVVILLLSCSAILLAVAGCDKNARKCDFNSQQSLDTVQTDPSLIPWDNNSIFDWQSDDRLEEIYHGKQFERCRYRADFNFDGIMDIALSEPLYTFGTGGGSYTLYIGNADGIFKKLAEKVFGGIMSLRMQKSGKGVLYVGSHCGGGCLSVTQYSVSHSCIKKIDSKKLHVGDNDDSIQEDNAECDRIFNDSDTLIRQFSKTNNGKVFWLTGPADIKSIDKLVSEIALRAKADDKEQFAKYIVGRRHGDLLIDSEKQADKHVQKLIEMILVSDMENNYLQHIEYIPPARAKLGYAEIFALCAVQLDYDYEKISTEERVQGFINTLHQRAQYVSPAKARLLYNYPEKGCCFGMEFEEIEEYGTWYIEDIWFCR